MPESLQCLTCPARLQQIVVGSNLAKIVPTPANLAPIPQLGVAVKILGGYGSKVYSPAPNPGSDEHLRGILCDRCLRNWGAGGLLRRVVITRPTPTISQDVWKPPAGPKAAWFDPNEAQ